MIYFFNNLLSKVYNSYLFLVLLIIVIKISFLSINNKYLN